MDKSVRDKLYGDLIVDFANASSSEEAGLKFLDNVQKVLNFSPQFTTKAQNKFPTLSNFKSSFSKQEWKLLESFTEIFIFFSQNEHFPNISLDGYEFYYPDEKLLIFYVYSPDFPDGKEYEIEIEQSDKKYTEELKNLFDDAVDNKVSIEEKPKMFDEFLKYTERYLALGDKTWDLKKYFYESNFFEIREQAAYYFNYLLKEHKHINALIKQLKCCLQFIIDKSDDDKKTGFNALDKFASFYNDKKRPNIHIMPSGRIIRDKLYEKEFFIEREKFGKANVSEYLEKFYDEIIAYCMFEYLPSADNERKLKKCPYCQNFFIAKDIRRSKCYSSECSKEYEREKKQKQRSDDPVKYV